MAVKKDIEGNHVQEALKNYLHTFWPNNVAVQTPFALDHGYFMPISIDEIGQFDLHYFPLSSYQNGWLILILDKDTNFWEFIKNKFADYEEMDKVKNSLLDSESKAKSSHDLVDLSMSWYILFRDEEKAMKILQEAESKAVSSSDLVRLAESWFSMFNDEEKRELILEEAESRTNETNDYINLAECLFGSLHDEERAKQLLEKGESAARDSFEYAGLAETWFAKFNEKEKAKGLLEKAENIKKVLGDRINIEVLKDIKDRAILKETDLICNCTPVGMETG
ncbi:MAG: hypothetical protein ACMUIE_09875, partial [Thermoplasmatota archaeon]